MKNHLRLQFTCYIYRGLFPCTYKLSQRWLIDLARLYWIITEKNHKTLANCLRQIIECVARKNNRLCSFVFKYWFLLFIYRFVKKVELKHARIHTHHTHTSERSCAPTKPSKIKHNKIIRKRKIGACTHKHARAHARTHDIQVIITITKESKKIGLKIEFHLTHTTHTHAHATTTHTHATTHTPRA